MEVNKATGINALPEGEVPIILLNLDELAGGEGGQEVAGEEKVNDLAGRCT